MTVEDIPEKSSIIVPEKMMLPKNAESLRIRISVSEQGTLPTSITYLLFKKIVKKAFLTYADVRCNVTIPLPYDGTTPWLQPFKAVRNSTTRLRCSSFLALLYCKDWFYFYIVLIWRSIITTEIQDPMNLRSAGFD